MNITDCIIKPELGDSKAGYIYLPEEFRYEIVGPFGVGYKIKVKKTKPKFLELISRKGILTVRRDDPGGEVRTPYGKYEMNRNSIFHKNGILLELGTSGAYESIQDQYAMALFIVNHYFSSKTGPFEKNIS